MVDNAEGPETVVRVVAINPDEPREDRLDEALASLSAGGVVALPTETFYGLAVDAGSVEALSRVNRLKGKDAGSAVLLLLSDRSQAGQVAGQLPALFEQLAQKFWPGPLTLVVPASPRLAREVTGGRGTVALRVPGLGLPRRLAALLGRPISGVSANLHGEPPCRTAGCVARAFPEGVDVVLDGGPAAGGAPSTVLDISGSRPRILREGLLPASVLLPHVEAQDLL